MNQELKFKTIFLFWVPLAATWLMMAIEGPYVSAVIARLSEPKYNLAAFGIAIALGLLVEAPIIMIMSAAVALVKDRETYRRVRNFSFALNFGVTAVMAILVTPPVFRFIAEDIIGLPPPVAHLAHIASIILLPWPGAIGFRRFYQGILIKYDLTRRVAYGTAVRLTAMSLTALLLYLLDSLEGAYIGTAALSMGVVSESLAVRLMTHKTVVKIKKQKRSPEDQKTAEEPPTYWEITKFYYPLALSSIMGLAIVPMINFFLGRSRLAVESLAVLPVINGLNFLFVSLALSFQEVSIALLSENRKNYPAVRSFALLLGILLVCGSVGIAFTPLFILWFHNISGLTMELTGLSVGPYRMMVILPGLVTLLSFQRSILVLHRKTMPITIATAIEIIAVSSSLYVSIHFFDAIGAFAAALAFDIGKISSNSYLLISFAKVVRSNYASRSDSHA